MFWDGVSTGVYVFLGTVKVVEKKFKERLNYLLSLTIEGTEQRSNASVIFKRQRVV